MSHSQMEITTTTSSTTQQKEYAELTTEEKQFFVNPSGAGKKSLYHTSKNGRRESVMNVKLDTMLADNKEDCRRNDIIIVKDAPDKLVDLINDVVNVLAYGRRAISLIAQSMVLYCCESMVNAPLKINRSFYVTCFNIYLNMDNV